MEIVTMSTDLSKLPVWILALSLFLVSVGFLVSLYALKDSRKFAGLEFGPTNESSISNKKFEINFSQKTDELKNRLDQSSDLYSELASKLENLEGNIVDLESVSEEKCEILIDSGEINLLVSLNTDQSKTYEITYSTNYSSIPKVILGISGFSIHPIGGNDYAGAKIEVTNITTKGFQAVFTSPDFMFKEGIAQWLSYACK